MDDSRTDLPLIRQARAHGSQVGVIDKNVHSYADLLDASARVAAALLQGRLDLHEARITFIIPPGFEYVAVQWGIWRAGGIAVPLALSHPPAEWAYVLDDTGAEAVVTASEYGEPLTPVASTRGVPIIDAADLLREAHPSQLPSVDPSRRAMIVYTSGTTGHPKGAVTTHDNIQAQVTSLLEAWEWSKDDRILLVLPLHHVHGIINVLTCALWAGATCEMSPAFDAGSVWERLGSGKLTLFMAVPTIYRRLITAWETMSPQQRDRMGAGCRGLRLMVSGSAALPADTRETWQRITGHVLLERYGMTEIGMALSNALRGERRPGTVGTKLPGVDVRLVENGIEVPLGTPGELEVRGPSVFLEYWQRPEETRAAFRNDWFRTGDLAVLEDGAYRILGRMNVDIIKTGGYKVSALEIEEVLRGHEAIADCSVVGLEDPDWGERVGVLVELVDECDLGLEALKEWARERLAPYKLPRVVGTTDALPRNAMGKVIKSQVVEILQTQG
jgi:malonyl-CoA/methylmalonyl-CoA synthetase